MAAGVESLAMSLGMRSGPDALRIDAITLFVGLLCACILIDHLVENSTWMNGSTTALLIGLCVGGIHRLTTVGKNTHLFLFNEELFFIYILPPIIFNAGFRVKKKRFFENFMTIMSFGIIGTLISFFIISFGAEKLFNKLGIDYLDAGDFLALGAIFSATDSVCTLQVLNQEQTPLLYSLVFGEGVVNDATSIVLFNAIQRFDLSHVTSGVALKLLANFIYLFATSTLLGAVVGLVSAYIIKKMYFGRHSTVREVALMALLAYLSYMMAELFNLSAILTVFFCGISMSHYTWHNVTESSRVTTRHAFAALSYIAEILIFIYVGVDAFDSEKWNAVKKSPGTSVGVSSILLGLVLVGRAAFIFPLSFISNLTRKSQDEKINLKKQVVIWWAGLMRGAVSIALAYNKFSSSGHTQLRGNAIMITSTITVVLFSTMVFGLLTKPLISLLLTRKYSSSSSELTALADSKSLSLPLLVDGKDPEPEPTSDGVSRPKSLRMLLTTPTNTVHYYWRLLDDSFMRPVFGGRGHSLYHPGSPSEGSLH